MQNSDFIIHWEAMHLAKMSLEKKKSEVKTFLHSYFCVFNFSWSFVMKFTMTSFIKWSYYSICEFFEIFLFTRLIEHLFLQEAYLLTLI